MPKHACTTFLFSGIHASIVRPTILNRDKDSKYFIYKIQTLLRVPVFKRLEMQVWFLAFHGVFVLVPILAHSFYLRKGM